MIFAMADIHGYADVFQRRIQQIEGYLEKGHQLILLGDYIDRGPASYQSLHLTYSLQKKYGKDRVVVLKGNHEQWFLDFLYEGAEEWLAEDENNRTKATFLSEEELEEIIGGIEDGLSDQQIKEYFLLQDAEKMSQFRRMFRSVNRRNI